MRSSMSETVNADASGWSTTSVSKRSTRSGATRFDAVV